MESDTVTLTIARQQGGALLSSAHELIGVKVDAIAHAKSDRGNERARRIDLRRHRTELLQARRLAGELERVVHQREPRELTSSRQLLDEVVASALVVESQALADAAVVSSSGSDVGDLAVRCHRVEALVAALATVRGTKTR